MFSPVIHAEAVYNLVSAKLHIGKYMDSGYCVYNVLDYSTGTLWNCDDDI